MRNKNQIPSEHSSSFIENNSTPDGFTLIELLVVIAIIALLTSIALIAYTTARSKSRDVKRLADMTQSFSGLELYFSTNKGYPSSTSAGIPNGLAPSFMAIIPASPAPADGGCELVSYPLPVPSGYGGSNYYYIASGSSYLGADGVTNVYSDYTYYFCLGNQTGNYGPGVHMLTSHGVR